jgi:hypothetical protein
VGNRRLVVAAITMFCVLASVALHAVEGDRAAALAALGRARTLNSRQPVVAEAIAAVRAGRPLPPDVLEAALAAQLERKLVPAKE